MPRKGCGLDFGLVGVPKKFKKPTEKGGHSRDAKNIYHLTQKIYHFFIETIAIGCKKPKNSLKIARKTKTWMKSFEPKRPGQKSEGYALRGAKN